MAKQLSPKQHARLSDTETLQRYLGHAFADAEGSFVLPPDGSLAAQAFEVNPDVALIVREDGMVILANAAARQSSQHASDDFAPYVNWRQFIPTEVHEAIAGRLAKAMRGDSCSFSTRQPLEQGGETYWAASFTPLPQKTSGKRQVLIVARDTSDVHKSAERARLNSKYDPLTGLTNRIGFHIVLKRIVRTAAGAAAPTLVLVHLDHLRRINEATGYEDGNALIRTVAERLQATLGERERLFRIGGDTFAIIIDRELTRATAVHWAERGAAQIRKLVMLSGKSTEVEYSIGIACATDSDRSSSTAERLLRDAEIALREAKKLGGDKIIYIEQTMRSQACRRTRMISTADTLLKEDRCRPHYQPQIWLRDGSIAGFESLLRYRGDGSNWLGPAKISAAFSDPRLAQRIGIAMQERIFEDIRNWTDAGHDFGHISINATDSELHDVDFAAAFLHRLEGFAVESDWVRLEVSEEVFLKGDQTTPRRNLDLLREAGIAISLDDFGTGHASLIHLNKLRISELKIDRSFVMGLDHPSNVAIVEALLKLGRQLNILTVAEGIEDERQRAFLADKGCDIGQGFVFAQALPATEVPIFIEKRGRLLGETSAA